MSRVLLVDDDIAEISAVKRVLVRAGHQPVLATNAADAMIAIDQQQPELLVVSATCENGEALTLARALRENSATAHLPLVVLGDADPLPKGARRVARPLDPELLGSELKAALAPADGISISVEPPAPEPQPAPRPAARAAAGRTGAARPGPGPVRPAAAKASPPSPGPARPEPGKPVAAKSAPAGAASPRPGAVAIGRLLPSPGAGAPPPGDGPAPADGSAGSDGTGNPDANPSPVRRGLPAPGSRTALPSGAKLSDAAASRRAAADALRARAEELRRSSQRPAPAPQAESAPSSVPRPSPILIEPIPAGSSRPSLAESLDLEEGELEATLERAEAASGGGNGGLETGRSAADQARREAAEEALRALEEEASSHAAEVARSRSAAAEETTGSHELPGREAASAAEERALQEAIETARRQAFESARREAFETAKRELQEQARQEAAEAARLIQAEARGRQEAVAAAQKEAKELARREAEATERARSAEQELQSLRSQLDEERRKAEERVATVMQRAAEEEEALEETSRSHAAEEQKLRGAIASARSEMEALRRRHDEESRRREEVEYALRRMAGGRRDRPGPTEDAAESAPDFTPPPFFAPFDGAEAPDPDPAEEAARRRVAALRSSPPGDGEAETAPGPGQAGGDGTGDEEPSLAPEEPARSIPQPSPQLRAGDLVELPAPRLLAMAWRARLEGRLDFRGETARSLWFEDGRVVGASSADPSERVEEVALRLGLITRDQHRQIAQAAATLPSRRAALLLLERGFLKATELTGLVRRRTEEVVFGVFADAEARFRWMGIEVPADERTALERGTLALAVEGVRRRWLAPRVDALLGGPSTLLAPAPGGPAAAELGLSAEERRVVGLADGLRALEEVLQASPLDALSTRQVLAALVLIGALAIRALQAGRPTGHALAAIDLARVKEKLEQVRRADYFTVLGVGRLCTPHEVREAAERLQAEFDPRRFAAQGDEGLPARLAEILEVVHDAREVLADDRLRDEYLRGLGDAG